MKHREWWSNREPHRDQKEYSLNPTDRGASIRRGTAKGLLYFCAVLFVSILFSAAAFAQNDVGTIVGYVTDPSGAVVNNAQVTATNEGTKAKAHNINRRAGPLLISKPAACPLYHLGRCAGFKEFIQHRQYPPDQHHHRHRHQTVGRRAIPDGQCIGYSRGLADTVRSGAV